jgi:hypothetical protein
VGDEKVISELIVSEDLLLDLSPKISQLAAWLEQSFSSDASPNLANSPFRNCVSVVGLENESDAQSLFHADSDKPDFMTVAHKSDMSETAFGRTLKVPRFKLYRNQMGALYPDRKSLRVRLVGGNTTAMPSEMLSNRDAVGARVLVTFESGKKVMLQRQAGEGFASQKSSVLSTGFRRAIP